MAKLGLDAALEATDKAAKKAVKLEYFKVEETPKTIRFITAGGMHNSIMTYYEHYVKFKNGWSRAFSCPDDSGTSTCVICKMKVGQNGDILENNYGTKFVMQVIERNAKDKEGLIADRVKIFKFSPFLMTTLKAFMDSTGDIGDRDYNISMIKEKQGNKTKIVYVLEPVTKKALPTSDEDDALIESKADLLDAEPAYDEAEVRRLAAMTAQTPAASTSVEDTLSDFLSAKDDDDILGSLTKKVESTPSLASDDEEDEDDDKEFFKTLRKHKS